MLVVVIATIDFIIILVIWGSVLSERFNLLNNENT